MTELATYSLLFAVAFGAASILPFYSEPLLIGLVASEHYPAIGLWLAASSGNTAGAVLNWYLARFILLWQDKRWFPVSSRQLDRASRWFQRYGVWTLLLAWAPVGGDALTFVAGLFRVRLSLFILLVGLGKSARYAFVIWSTEAVIDWQ